MTRWLCLAAVLAACRTFPEIDDPDRDVNPSDDGGDDAEDPPDGDPGDSAAPEPTWTPVVIDFDDLAAGTRVTDQYAAATFSTEENHSIQVYRDVDFGNSEPNYICTSLGGISCEEDIYVDFTRPVRDLSIRALGDDFDGTIAEVRLLADGELLGTEPVIGDGDRRAETHTVVDLGGYAGVTRMEIVEVTDRLGLAWDDLTFEQRDD